MMDYIVCVGSEVSIDTFFMMVRYTCSDLGVTDAEILDLIDKIDVNGAVAASFFTAAATACPPTPSTRPRLTHCYHTGDRMIQKEEFDDFVKELIGV